MMMVMNDRDRPLYMISVAAELAGLHPQTLRIYEAKGLVAPKRSAGNTRLYSQADIERLELIGQLTSEGINLAGVIRILDFEDRLSKRDEEVEVLRRKVSRLEDTVHEFEMRQTITTLVRVDQTTSLRLLDSKEAHDNSREMPRAAVEPEYGAQGGTDGEVG